MEEKRVVITGIGAVSCVGNSVAAMWDSLLNGRSGIAPVTIFDASGCKTQIAGEVKNFDPLQFVDAKDARRLDDYCIFSIAAYEEARKDAGLPRDFRDADSPVDPDRIGVIIGTGIGGMRTIESQARVLVAKGPSRISPFFIPMLITNIASGEVAIRTGAQGPNYSAVSACASSAHAISDAFYCIQRGDADMMITGGAEAAVSELGFAGFCSMKAMSTRNDDPTHASRPFDLDRDGFVMSEGAGILILEELEHAKKRGARIYAEIIGCGATGDAYHITSPAPGGSGCVKAYQMALKHAGIAAADVDYVNAHGTSTHLNDLYETQAMKTVFGEHAREMAISSTKGTMGHGLGAAGGLETLICAKVIETGIVPPTINYTTPDPECDLDYTPNTPRERKVNVAVNTNLGFGGHNAVIILRRAEA